ncbi:hypothetical protein [Geodermatophilus sp. URMC 64]
MPAVVVAPSPVATFPRRIRGEAPDGRPWELLTSRTGVSVVTDAGRLAEAQVAEEQERVVVDFWADAPGLSADIGARLVGQAFAHPAVRAHRPILVTLPRGESSVLEHVQAHLDGARSHVAGVTCLVEGRVREAPSGC